MSVYRGLVEQGESFGVYGYLAGLCDVESGGDAFGLYSFFVEYPEASLGEAVAFSCGWDDAEAYP